MEKVLFVAAHPDDETLGCGGSILRHKRSGDQIYWLIITDMYLNNIFNEKTIKSRQRQVERISRAYGFQDVFKLNFQTTRLDSIPFTDVVEKISKIVKKLSPQTIYLPHSGDAHTDHKITHNAVIASTKSFNIPSARKTISYEVVSETEFVMPYAKDAFIPNLFIDITPYMDRKVEIMKLYKGEIKEFPFPRSERNIKALATFRGATMGASYAEAFMLLREFLK